MVGRVSTVANRSQHCDESHDPSRVCQFACHVQVSLHSSTCSVMHDSVSTAAVFCSGLAGGAALLAAFQHVARRRALESTQPLDAQDPEAIRHPAAALTELIVRYHENLQRRDPHRGEPGNSSYSIRSKVKPGELRDQLPATCPEDPQSYADIFRDVKQLIFPALTHWAAPNFHAYFKICGSDPSVLADYLCSSLDVIGFSWVSAPAATELEQVVCDWMAKLLGLPECFLTSSPGGGVIQGSASESALCALIAARHAALEGLEGAEREEKAAKLVIYVSDQTHAIAEKGCMVLDIPHLRVVPTIKGKADTDNYGLAPDDVARAMAEDRAKGLVPFCLMPTLGTTSTTAIDPLRKLIAVAREQPEHVWVHLDGAYGGAAAVCPEYQHWLDGAEGCDSICINTHKWLLVSFDASLLWVKDRRPLIRSLALDPEYLKNDFMQSAPNYKDWQVPLGRRFRALKLWFTFRRFGANGLRAHIRHSVELAKRAEELLEKDGRFKFFVRARMGLVCFYVAFGGRELNEALLRRVNESGKAFLIHSVVDSVHFLRLAIGGLEVDTWHIENVVDVLSKTLTEVIDENPKWQELQRESFASAAAHPAEEDSIVIMGERRLDSNWSMQVTALYDYEPEQFDELGFQEGNVLQVLRVQDDGWWSGYNVEIPNVVGLFPSNYVQAQRTVPPKRLVDAGTTPRLPVSSRQRIQQRPRYAPDTPEFEDEDVDDDKMQEPRSEYRGHIRAILQLRKNLEEAEQSSEALRDARRQAERERLRHRKSWRERKQIEEDVNHHRRQLVQANQQQQEIPPGDEDAEEEDESVFPQQQGYVHESDRQQAKDFEVDLNSNIDEKNRMQTDVGQIADTTDAANAAATLIVRRYRQHIASVQYNREREKEAEQQKLSKIAAVCIQHAYSRQRKRRQHELEQHRARQRLKREVDAATEIQKWIRLRWACFWRKRVQIVREERTAKEAQQCTEMMKAELRQAQLEEKLRLDTDNEEVRRRLAKEEESRHIKSEEDQRRVLQQNLENKEQHRLRAVEEEVQQRSVQGESQEEECGQHDNDRAVPRQSTQAPSHEKSRRKVMKKEAVELIKSLVQQQLGDTLRDHDSKMDELQRMVVRLQTVVRKQTAMLQDSTDQLINLQMRKQEQRVPMPPRTSDTGSCSSLPRINGQSSVPRQPVAPSGLRPPRPAMSKLPGLVSVGRRTGSNESKKL